MTQAQVKATLTTKRNDGRINCHNHVMSQHWRANVDLQVIIDTDQCMRYMAKYATKGEPRSQSASEILTACVNRLDNTDMASSALRRAMIQVAGERDIGSQETAHMLLGKPLYSCTYSFLCVSLDGSRRVRTGDEDDENQGDQALDPSVLDHYATRANWQENNPGILNLNLVQFASAYYVTTGELKHRKQEIIIRTFPIFSPNPSRKNYGNYCKYALVKYKPWSGEVNTAWDGLDDNHENHIQCYHAFQCCTFTFQSYSKSMVHSCTKHTDGTGSTIRVVLFDSPKVFDLIDHALLARNLLALDMPVGISLGSSISLQIARRESSWEKIACLNGGPYQQGCLREPSSGRGYLFS